MTRIAVIQKDRCNPDKCGWLCFKLCPVNRTGGKCILKADKAKIDESLCTGCGICTKRCPFEAISIVNLPEELTKQPIHRYGQNGFHLYNLPVPMFGKVTGIIGKNGIGKSTAVKILAGILKPNLGTEKETTQQQLIEYFKGTEAQIFFEKIKDKKIKLSYKPQQVDLIPQQFKGKVKDLLKKVDEKKQMEKIAKQLEIDKILNNKINEISGGELQRVAIAATVLKKADVYFFDEPTSYLDIKQRLKVAKFIRSLANKNTAVVVVEHDLIILDYIADLINIMYGQEDVYGIVSLPKTSKAGINIYLEGYLKEENIRFRDKKIKFTEKQHKKAETAELTSWQAIEKKLGQFKLKAEQGVINKKQMIGILGENAIGKTTFVKILADVLKPDKGNITTKVKVSYKPQYLKSSNETVANILKEAIAKHETQIIRPLNLKHLLEKKLNELSGGQLQRVAIALCLSKDADLYLLDEPSAYLDVEQRLMISKIIKDFITLKQSSALIVDHDLLFIDYISENLIVFQGKPALEGHTKGPFPMEEGMNIFLKELNITFRRDKESLRPRANKEDSQMDSKQKKQKKFYYV